MTNPFRYIADAYKRWRHSRGFGVHSPFAYNLVTLAIRPGRSYGYRYGYHGYEAIDALCCEPGEKTYPRMRKDARLLLGLCATLRCRRLATGDNPGGKIWKVVADAAGMDYIDYNRRRDFIPALHDMVLANGATDIDMLRRIFANGAAAFIFDITPAQKELIFSECRNGLLFEGRRITVVIPRKEMAFVSYSMKM